MTRIEGLHQVCRDLHGSRLAKKLTESEFDDLVAFCEDHEDLGHLEFEYAVNRWHLDQPNRPKNCFLMQELAICANVRARGNKRRSK